MFKKILFLYVLIVSSLYSNKEILTLKNNPININCTQNITNSITRDVIMNCDKSLERLRSYINAPKTDEEFKKNKKEIQNILKNLKNNPIINKSSYLKRKLNNIQIDFQDLKKTLTQIINDNYRQNYISASAQLIDLKFDYEKLYFDLSIEHELLKLNSNKLFIELFVGLNQTKSEYSVLTYNHKETDKSTNYIGGIGSSFIFNELFKASARIGGYQGESLNEFKKKPIWMLSLSIIFPIYKKKCYIESGYRWIGNLPTEEISFNPLGDAHINKSKDSYYGLFIGLKFTWGKYDEDD